VRVNARGQTNHYRFDELDRLVGVDYDPIDTSPPLAFDATVVYDDVRSRDRKAVVGPDYSTELWYDDFGRVSKERLTTQSKTLYADYTYDRLGRPRRIAYPLDWYGIEYVYSGAHLIRVCRAANSTPTSGCGSEDWISSVSYDALGNRDQTAMPPGVLDFDHSPFDRRFQRVRFGATPTSGTVLDLYYAAYDDVGNILSVTDQAVGNGITLGGSYHYDAWNRVDQWNGLAYGYDALGNLTSRPKPGGGGQTHAFSATKPHQLESVDGGSAFGYDADGNRTLQPAYGSQPERHYTFDSESRLVRVESSAGGPEIAAHGYDVDGRRIWSRDAGGQTTIVLGELFQYNRDSGYSRAFVLAFGELVGTRDVSNTVLRQAGPPPALPVPPELPGWLLGAAALGLLGGLALRAGVPAQIRRRPVHGTLAGTLSVALVLLPARPTAAGGGGGVNVWRRWQIADPLGTTVLVVNPAGVVVSRQQRDPYGLVFDEWHSENNPLEHRYAGQRRDAASGLYDFSARWYDASTGGFLSVDPVIASLADPHSHNAYAYARGNPMTFQDPTGMWFWSGLTNLFWDFSNFLSFNFGSWDFNLNLGLFGAGGLLGGLDFSFSPGRLASISLNVGGFQVANYSRSLRPQVAPVSQRPAQAAATSTLEGQQPFDVNQQAVHDALQSLETTREATGFQSVPESRIFISEWWTGSGNAGTTKTVFGIPFAVALNPSAIRDMSTLIGVLWHESVHYNSPELVSSENYHDRLTYYELIVQNYHRAGALGRLSLPLTPSGLIDLSREPDPTLVLPPRQ
jgi:RHS repeat-associated protein